MDRENSETSDMPKSNEQILQEKVEKLKILMQETGIHPVILMLMISMDNLDECLSSLKDIPMNDEEKKAFIGKIGEMKVLVRELVIYPEVLKLAREK